MPGRMHLILIVNILSVRIKFQKPIVSYLLDFWHTTAHTRLTTSKIQVTRSKTLTFSLFLKSLEVVFLPSKNHVRRYMGIFLTHKSSCDFLLFKRRTCGSSWPATLDVQFQFLAGVDRSLRKRDEKTFDSSNWSSWLTRFLVKHQIRRSTTAIRNNLYKHTPNVAIRTFKSWVALNPSDESVFQSVVNVFWATWRCAPPKSAPKKT